MRRAAAAVWHPTKATTTTAAAHHQAHTRRPNGSGRAHPDACRSHSEWQQQRDAGQGRQRRQQQPHLRVRARRPNGGGHKHIDVPRARGEQPQQCGVRRGRQQRPRKPRHQAPLAGQPAASATTSTSLAHAASSNGSVASHKSSGDIGSSPIIVSTLAGPTAGEAGTSTHVAQAANSNGSEASYEGSSSNRSSPYFKSPLAGLTAASTTHRRLPTQQRGAQASDRAAAPAAAARCQRHRSAGQGQLQHQ